MYSAEQGEDKLLETGDYEVEISNADVRSFKSGTQYLNIALRTDAGDMVYGKIFRSKTNPSEFDGKQVGRLLGAVKYKPEIANDFQLTQVLKGRKCIAHIIKEYDDYTQGEINRVGWYKGSDRQAVTEETQPMGNNVNIDDSMLPF